MDSLIRKLKLKSNFKKNFLNITFAFLIGIIIPSVPYIKKIFSNINNNRIIELENKNARIKLKEKCKSANSKYNKLLNLGFQNFAIEEFNNCMQENIKN